MLAREPLQLLQIPNLKSPIEEIVIMNSRNDVGMKNTALEDERLKKTSAVILAIVAVVTLSAVPLIAAALQNALAATSVRHGSISYDGHHYARTSLSILLARSMFP